MTAFTPDAPRGPVEDPTIAALLDVTAAVAASHTEADRLRALLADTAVAWRRAELAAHDIDEPGLWWDLLGQVRDIADRLDAHTNNRPRGEKR